MPRSILDTPLLKKTLADQGKGDRHAHERKLLRDALLQMREKAEILVQEIPRDIPGLTVHDVTHLDALWEMAALIAGDNYPLTPAEAFVLGGAILLHDAAMSLAAYPGGIDELKETTEWRDEAAAIRQELEPDRASTKLDPESEKEVLARALRARHAEQAKKIATRGWSTGLGSEYLIDNGELRSYYGELIGNIAHSHWWPVSKLESQLPRSINAARKLPHDWTVDPVRVACLLRVADAAHLSAERAPRFLMAIRNPKGQSALHWSFQTKLGNPRREDDRLIYATGSSFGIEETDAWWLCYDTLGMVQRELHDVDILLDGTNRTRLAAKQVAGAGSPDMLAKLVRVEGWKPVDAKLNVSNVPTLVRTLGGEKLYGDNPIYAVRELIQNSCDAIRARRILEKRPDDWGTITVGLNETTEGVWLVVSDDGIGMSERVLTGPLLDFGQSFWRSSLAKEEFPGLHAGGMSAIGQFGIGFFSIFMLGERVKVTSRRFDTGKDKALSVWPEKS
ncbi:MAG: ATP-binding protein [Rhodospirillales bacterium]|nr:ATP-binding protein [Rhodospirillales bacterium]